MSWLQVSINTTKEHAEAAEDCLFSCGAQTVTLTDAADQAILEPGVNEVPIWNEVVITGLFNFDNNESASSKQALLGSIKNSMGTIQHDCHSEILKDKNWTRAWMDHYHPMQFGERLWVCPLHLEPPDTTAVNLRLDPGLAFGTGTHPTTSLCLKWLDTNITQQKTVLDYGCGSGILAIAACMLGASHSDGVDIDPQALIATHNNAETNNVNQTISSYLPDDFQQKHSTTQYDTVMANILSGPLAELAPTLAKHTKTGGDIILSGILREQADSVATAYDHFFKMDGPVFEEDWTLLHGTKKPPHRSG